MSSSLFGVTQINSSTSNKNILFKKDCQINSSGNSNANVSRSMKINPQFTKFSNDYKSRSVKQICSVIVTVGSVIFGVMLL